MSNTKDTNPKDAVGAGKVPASCTPRQVLREIDLGLLEGARKYGRHNYRVAGVRFSIYFDAVMRHLDAWWEGQDLDPDSGLSHITKAMCTLVVLRDAMLSGMYVDDRPPVVGDPEWVARLNAHAAKIIERYASAKEPFTATDTPADVDRKLGRVPSAGPCRCSMCLDGPVGCGRR